MVDDHNEKQKLYIPHSKLKNSPYAEDKQLPIVAEGCHFNIFWKTKHLHLTIMRSSKPYLNGRVCFWLEARLFLHLSSLIQKRSPKRLIKKCQAAVKRKACFFGHEYRVYWEKTAWRNGQVERDKNHLLV